MTSLLDRFERHFLRYDDLDFALDISRMRFADDFFEKMQPRIAQRFEVEKGITSGDYLHGFLRGTRAALYENGRESITISIPEVNAFQLGALIALYERAVGFYASLVNINAYHQPGVEAGKKAATRLLELQHRVRATLPPSPGQTADEIARSLEADPEDVHHLLRHMAANDPTVRVASSDRPSTQRFFVS
jgi:glucose-6-phosphate isomerase